MLRTAPRIPTPALLYVHDNLTPLVRERFGVASRAYDTAQRFLAEIAREPHVKIGTLEKEIASLTDAVTPEPFDVAFGFGRKGEEIARILHGRWGAFPRICLLDITRVENGDGTYVLVSRSGRTIGEQVAAGGAFRSCALVDDVLYTGFTVRSVLRHLPRERIGRCALFFTRGIGESKAQFEDDGCTAHVGISLPGVIEKDVSTISVLNLVTEGAIRTRERNLRYTDRPEWIEAWFPHRSDRIVELADRVTELLKNISEQERAVKPHVMAFMFGDAA